MSVRILQGDCREVLKTLPDESVHCVVTSPPYFGLRDYGVDGQMGLEATPESFVAGMVEVFREVRRVLRKDGTLWLNLGDSYAGAGRGSEGDKVGLDGSRHNQRESRKALIASRRRDDAPVPRSDLKHRGFKTKDLMMMPARVAIALQEDGWYLRQDIIWAKPNPMPESVHDRCTKAHEYVFLLSKSRRYHFDAEAISEPASMNTHERRSLAAMEFPAASTRDNNRRRMPVVAGWDRGPGAHDKLTGNYHTKARKLAANGSGTKNNSSFDEAMAVMPERRNKRSVWEITTRGFPEAHFATFPPELPEICIKAGCPQGGVVLDPFGGAGTTGLVADRLQRDCILIELNPEYAAMAERRIKGDAPMFAEVSA